MFSVPDFLDRAKVGAGGVTDYRLAKILGVTHSAVSTWRTGTRAPDESAIEALCKLSGDDARIVAAEIQAMRASSDVARDLWERIADALKASQLIFVAIVLGALFADDARAALPSHPTDAATVCVLCQLALQMLRRFAMRVAALGVKNARHGQAHAA